VTPSLGSAPVAFLTAGQGTDGPEFTHAWQAVLARGGQPVLVSQAPREIDLRSRFDRAETAPVDVQVQGASAASFAGLVLPGGMVHSEVLRVHPPAVGFVRDFFSAGLPVAAMGRASRLLIEADVIWHRRLTSWPGMRADLSNAGAIWVADHVVTCDDGPNTLITCRERSDLPAFCDIFTRKFSGSAGSTRPASPARHALIAAARARR
jgi:protease I